MNIRVKSFLYLMKIIKQLAILFFISFTLTGYSEASIIGAHGFSQDEGTPADCKSADEYVYPTATFVPGMCTLNFTAAMYVPHSGLYRVRTAIYTGKVVTASALSTEAYFDATKPLKDQQVTVSGTLSGVPSSATFKHADICRTLVDEAGNDYSGGTDWCYANKIPIPPLPPTPPTPSTCSVNDGNDLKVNLSTVDRELLPTEPGVGSLRHIQIPVECSGSAAFTVTMKLSYTPISIGSAEGIKTSSTGLGVAVIYDSKPLATADVTTATFVEGSNTLDLAFQAVRDPTVSASDIPTGAFTASAVLVMTQQ